MAGAKEVRLLLMKTENMENNIDIRDIWAGSFL